MNKPNGYDEAIVGGEFTPVELGGHYCVVKQVTETTSSSGKNMVVVLLDFDDNDKQPHYFSTQFQNDDREEKKWPFNGSKWIMVQDYNDPNKTSRQFKTFCTCIEKSNQYTIKWGGKNWGQQFTGKKIGAVYGEEEHAYDGKVSMRRLPKWFCSIDSVKDAAVPQTKYLNGNPPTTPAPTDDGFADVSEAMTIPF